MAMHSNKRIMMTPGEPAGIGPDLVAALARACDGCLNGEFAVLITGPVNKGVINDAGMPFIGHTEFFADHSGCDRVVMI